MIKVTAIDAGSYSIKILIGEGDKRSFTSHGFHEIPYHQFQKRFNQPLEAQELLAQCLKDFIHQDDFTQKTIIQAPNNHLTVRFLTFPTNKKKVAERMIPFQLEEDVPLMRSHMHIGSRLWKEGGQYRSISNVVQLEYFEKFYQNLQSQEVLPNLITSEVSLIQNLLPTLEDGKNICILDLGHQTSKAYMVRFNQIISYHVNYTAGQHFNEVLSNTYGVEIDEAISYKHANAYFLTKGQMEMVDNDQREFAEIMEQAIKPLIVDLKKWIIGYKVTTNETIDRILITGGTSNIKNISNYLYQMTGIPCSHLSEALLHEIGPLDMDPAAKNSVHLALAGGLSITRKMPVLDFCHGEFSRHGVDDIPLHSAAFIGLRVVLCTLLLSLIFGAENFFLQQKDDELNRKVSTAVKNPVLELNPNEQRIALIRLRPEVIQTKLKKLDDSIREEINSINHLSGLDALRPLGSLSESVQLSEGQTLTEFQSQDNEVTAIFKLENWSNHPELRDKLDQLGFKDARIDLLEDRQEISFNFKVR